MANQDEAIVQLQVGAIQGKRAEWVNDQKKAIIEAIGTAQAVLVLGKTPKGEVRKRLLNPKKPAGPGNPWLSYVEHAYVEETLNLAFMLDWDAVVVKSTQVGNDIVLEGYIEVRTKNGKAVRKTGFGSARYYPENPAVELGDAYKSAYSDMIKNAATKLGIGLDLYRHEEKITEVIQKQTAKAAGEPDGEKLGSPATEAQISTIQKLGGKVPDDLTGFTFAMAAEQIKSLAQQKNAKPAAPAKKE